MQQNRNARQSWEHFIEPAIANQETGQTPLCSQPAIANQAKPPPPVSDLAAAEALRRTSPAATCAESAADEAPSPAAVPKRAGHGRADRARVSGARGSDAGRPRKRRNAASTAHR